MSFNSPSSRVGWLILIFILPLILVTACRRIGAGNYETPTYGVLQSDGPYEIRDYPASTLVSTTAQKRGENGAFMRLFHFISGRNEKSEKIAMTVPVLMSGSTPETMSFVMPARVVKNGVPNPSDPSLNITAMPGGHYAAYRFSGRARQAQFGESVSKLQTWMMRHDLSPIGSPVLAVYDPPWTPGFMRHNEVLIPLASTR